MFTDNLKVLHKTFTDAGFELRLVGGCVRDYLMGIEPKDIDLCTTATPDQMVKLPLKKIETGLQHGTLTFVIGDDAFEVTTLRVDVACDGRHAQVEFTTSWEADAARRDLTINAMSMDFDGNVFDYFGGQDDLKNKVVRFVGNANDRITEDYLRIMRFVRFHDKFDGSAMDIDTAVTCRRNVKKMVQTVSVERIWMELSKMLMSKNANGLMHKLWVVGVLSELDLLPLNRNFSDEVDVVTRLWFSNKMAASDLADKFKLSATNANQLVFLDEVTKQLLKTSDFMKVVKANLVNNVPLDWVVSWLMLLDNSNLADFAKNWTVPVFPVRGQDLLDLGMKPGKDMGNKLKTLRKAWEDSDYKLTKEELLA